MKRILQNSFGKTILCLLVALLSGGTAWAGSKDYYSRVTATAVGEGKVYVKYKSAATNTELNNSGNFKNSSTAESGADSQYSTPTHKYYLSAKANVGSYFVGWYGNNDSQCTGNIVSTTDTNYEISFEASSTNGNNPTTQNRYAKFVAFEPVTFSVAAGSYYEPQSVTLSCATSDVTIKYSFDNSSWQTYSEAISVDATKTIYARAEKNQGQSNVYSAAYTILSKNSVVFVTEISIPYADGEYTLTQGTSGSVDVMTDGTVTASNSANTSVATVSGSTITPVAVGTTTITVTAAEGPTYLAGSETVTITVTAPEGLSEGEPSTPETYTIPTSGIGTYCSQYPIDLTALPTGVQAYTVKENTGSLVRMKEITYSNIKGGVGVIYKGEPGTVITFSYTDSENDPTEDGLLVGTLAPTFLAAGTAYGLKSGVFHPNTDGIINVHRAYVPAEGNAVKALTLEFEEEDPTGIDDVEFNFNDDDVIYNLAGQRINKMQKGINIINGKKILMK